MDERAPLPRAEFQPPAGRVLLLAPHADDDVIGAGGTVSLHVAAGDPVHIIVVYSGLRGDPDGRYSTEEYLELRKREARAGGAHLGFEDYEFWDYPEGHAPSSADYRVAARRLAARIAELEPDIVYAPWVGEYHIDHHVLARATRMALATLDFRGEAWGYEVWTPLVPTKIVDITKVYELKVAALREHRSQLEYNDLLHMALAITAQRSMYVQQGSRHGEAFCPLGPATEEDLAILRGGA